MATFYKYRFYINDGVLDFNTQEQADNYAFENGLFYEIISFTAEGAVVFVPDIFVFDVLEMAKVSPSNRVARKINGYQLSVVYLDDKFEQIDLQGCRNLKLTKIKENIIYLLQFTDLVAKDQLSQLNGNLIRLNDIYTNKLRGLTDIAISEMESLTDYVDILKYEPSYSADSFSIKRANPLDFEALFLSNEWDAISIANTKPIIDVCYSLYLSSLAINDKIDDLLDLMVVKNGAAILQTDINLIKNNNPVVLTDPNLILPLVVGFSRYQGLLGRAVAIDLDSPQLSASLDSLIDSQIINLVRKEEIMLGVQFKQIGGENLDLETMAQNLTDLVAFHIITETKKAEILNRLL